MSLVATSPIDESGDSKRAGRRIATTGVTWERNTQSPQVQRK